MGDLFRMSSLLAIPVAVLFLTLGLLPGWIAGYRKAQHYLPIAILTLVACADFFAHGALVWAIALIWSCYDKPKKPTTLATPQE